MGGNWVHGLFPGSRRLHLPGLDEPLDLVVHGLLIAAGAVTQLPHGLGGIEAVVSSQVVHREGGHQGLYALALGTRIWYSFLISTGVSPRRPLSRALGRHGHVVGLGGKARDRANVGLTWGGKRRHPIKAPHGAEA